MSKKKAVIVGASGYTGCELIKLLNKNSHVDIKYLFVSEQSQYDGMMACHLYPELKHLTELSYIAVSDQKLHDYITSQQIDLVFLATPHQVSHQLVDNLSSTSATILDLSGAYRLADLTAYPTWYQFTHQRPDLIASAAYGLAEWYPESICNASVIAVPGCYPTAALSSLKPLTQNNLITGTPVINATSGVSGAGKKPSDKTHFCEVSLQPYGIFNHRHQPEIEQYAETPVIFTPHLGNFKRGILMTTTAQLAPGVTNADIDDAFQTAYQHQPLIRLCDKPPAVDHIAHTPFCDLFWQINGNHIIVIAAIDNLIKGAAGQAVQCANILGGVSMEEGLL